MLHIFTYCTNKEKVWLLEKTAKIKNISLQIICELQSEYKGFVSKILKTKQTISNLPKNDIICFVDAYDVLCFADSEKEIIDKFKSYDCDLLMGAETNSYPYGYEDKYPNTEHTTNYKYINSGGFIGYKSAVMELYSWKSDDEIIEICKDGGDQTYFIQYFLETKPGPGVKCKMDYNEKIFQNMFLVSWYDFIIQNGRLYNTVLNEYPCFVHFNGSSYKDDKDEDIMLVFVDKLQQSIHSPEIVFDFTQYKRSTWPNPTIIPQLR